MFTSLFGDLGSVLDPFSKKSRVAGARVRPFEDTASMQAVPADELGQPVDRHQRDLVVTGSAAHALREHFASTRVDVDSASQVITLLDPTGVWAASVIRALSDAGGHPIERLNLREQTTLRTLAVIERARLARRNEDTLKVYHAEVRVPGRDNADIPLALMERSHLCAVIVGTMTPAAVESLFNYLSEAASQPTWRCPNLLFLLPPNAVWMADRIASMTWPSRVQVHALNESLTSAATVWNALLGQWTRVVADRKGLPTAGSPLLGTQEFPIKVADLGPPLPPVSNGVGHEAGIASAYLAAPMLRAARKDLDAAHAKRSLAELLAIEGLLCCAVVDSASGLVLAHEQHEANDVDIDRAAAGCTQVLRAHRLAARSMGLPDHIEEVTVGTGTRHQLMRSLSRHPELFLFALLNKHRSNLSLARFKLMEVEKALL